MAVNGKIINLVSAPDVISLKLFSYAYLMFASNKATYNRLVNIM